MCAGAGSRALVYVSERFKKDGIIREKYILRMQKAVADVKALGVSQSFIKQAMAPHLGSPSQQPV
jgi:hypothetical protein